MKLMSFTLNIYEILRQRGYNSFVLKNTINAQDRDYCHGREMQVLQPAEESKNHQNLSQKIGMEKLKDMLVRNDADYYVILPNDL